MDPQHPAPAAPRRKRPRSIGRYRIIDRLGKGAMGVVYSAHDSLMERTVAIKIMMTDFEDDPETSARLRRSLMDEPGLGGIVWLASPVDDGSRMVLVVEAEPSAADGLYRLDGAPALAAQ